MKTPFVLAVGLAWMTSSPPVAAQISKPSFSPPVLGYVFDERASSIHAVMGVSGAAWLNPAFAWPGAEPRIAPGRSFALVSQDGLRLIRWDSGALVAQRLSEPVEGAAKIVFSPSGGTAAIQWTAARRIEVWSGLPDRASRQWSVEIELPEAVLAAVAGDGSGAVLLDGSAALWLNSAGAIQPLSAGSGVRAAVFRPGSRDLLLISNNGGDALLLAGGQTVSGRFDAADFAAFSADGRSLILASQETGDVTMVDLATGAKNTVACQCRPDGLFPLSGNAVFRLSEAVKGGFPVFDGDSPEPRITFAAAPEVEP